MNQSDTERSPLCAPEIVLACIRDALDNDILHVVYSEPDPRDIGHPHVYVLQNGSSNPTADNHITSRPDARVVAIVERDADIERAAKELVSACFALKGRSPYAPDIILVNEWVKKDFLACITRHSAVHEANSGSNAPALSKWKPLGSKILELRDR